MNKDYFERQGSFSMQCGMHSINNLLTQQAYTKQQMEEICFQLSDEFINPHKHVMGGDYDANVIMLALQRKGFEVQWLDKRKQFIIPKQENKKTVGFLVNLAKPKKIYHKIMGFSARHWTVFRSNKDENSFTYCDSQLSSIKQMETQEVLKFMGQTFKNEGQVFWVYKQSNN